LPSVLPEQQAAFLVLPAVLVAGIWVASHVQPAETLIMKYGFDAAFLTKKCQSAIADRAAKYLAAKK
jgi:hypothetical protein